MKRGTVPASKQSTVTGFIFALISAASFALSGIFASSLISSGWTPGAAVTFRIGLSALVLLAPTVIMMRGKWHLLKKAWSALLLFGMLAIAGCQLAFFMAVEYLPPSIALLIEFMGPVLLIFWFWFRTKRVPALLTLFGAALALGGLATISGIGGSESLNLLGVFYALIAAVGLAVYFATGASSEHGIAPLPFVGLGLILATAVLAAASMIGILPFAVAVTPVVLVGTTVPFWYAVAGMVLISTVLAYILGVGASRLLGATMASFTGYSEPLFAIVWTIVFLAIAPTPVQWVGAALIITGVVAVKAGEIRSEKRFASS